MGTQYHRGGGFQGGPEGRFSGKSEGLVSGQTI